MVIDGHNDLALRRWGGEPANHLDLEAALAVGFAGGFFALHVPSPHGGDPPATPYAMAIAEPIPFDEAARITEELFETLCSLPVRRATSIHDFREGEITAIVHIEGAEAIAKTCRTCRTGMRAGCGHRHRWSARTRSPKVSRSGFPRRRTPAPASPTPAGLLVRACNELGILVDVSHLNDAGSGRDRDSDRPVSRHTTANAHAPGASTRNLTDAQLDAIVTRAASSGSTSPSRSCVRTE
jgi:membrane dipeptidase